MRDLLRLPNDLPVPLDDGACNHLNGFELPSIRLKTTRGLFFDLKDDTRTPTVVFFYPRTGEPSKPAPADWDLIPGARGCTPQSCGFRDVFDEFKRIGFQVYGASSQDSDYQKEFVTRNHIPFDILSDAYFELTNALNLPTFVYNGVRLIKRLALVIDRSKIEKVFYPVFPPNKNAETVLDWIRSTNGYSKV